MAVPINGVVLITGLNGFTGRHMQGLLRKTGYKVFGLVSDAPKSQAEFQVDIRDIKALARVVDAVAPDYIIHLAAISFVAHGDVSEIYDVNVIGTLNLIETLRNSGRSIRKLLLASSGNIYGDSASAALVTEETIPRPLNHYGISKLAAEHICRTAGHIPTLIVRPFNYTGVGQAESFVVPKLVSAFRSGRKKVRLGNIDTVRDISDVRWVVQVYLSLLGSNVVNETVNICSGRGTRIRDVISELQNIANYEIKIETDKTLLRSQEIPVLIGSCRKLEQIMEIPPRPTLTETLNWMYADSA